MTDGLPRHDSGSPDGGRSDGSAPTNLRHKARLAGAALAHHVLTGLLVAAALALGVWGLLAPPETDNSRTQAARPTPIQTARITTARRRLTWALEAHRIAYREYPANLARLADRGLVRRGDLSYPLDARNWTYTTRDGGFRLTVEGDSGR